MKARNSVRAANWELRAVTMAAVAAANGVARLPRCGGNSWAAARPLLGGWNTSRRASQGLSIGKLVLTVAIGIALLGLAALAPAQQCEVTSFTINDGATTTPSCLVRLNNTCTGGPTEYLASEAPAFTGATWQPYSAAPLFLLSLGDGTKTVYFRVRNGAGQSTRASDTIALNTGAVGGAIVAWGYNYSGQCNVPAPNTGFVAVAAGQYHSLGLRADGADGSIVAWGSNFYGECNVPAPNAGFVAVAAGDEYSLGLKADGSIAAWGWNVDGECNVPAPNTGFVAVAACYWHSLGLKANGSIVGWGWNGWGQCNPPAPNTDFVALAAGTVHSLGLKADGSIVAWGVDSVGQCNIPAPNAGFVAVAAAQRHSLGLKNDGSVVAWGQNDYGECNVPAPNTGFLRVAAGTYHSLGLIVPRPGACCFVDGHCEFLKQEACTDAGGVWQGRDTTCTPNSCMQPTGACCVHSACTPGQTQAECMALGGTYQGSGTTCAPTNPCPLCPGDADCSGRINFDDINYFVAALAGAQTGWEQFYGSQHSGQAPPCPYLNNDVDGDGRVSFDDISPFVDKLVNMPPCP